MARQSDDLIPYRQNDGTPSMSEALTRQFYAWELRGRGWQVVPYPVDIEPPFAPFLWHALPPVEPGYDDGRRHTFASGLIARLKGALPPANAPALRVPEEDAAGMPEPAEDAGEYVTFRLSPPPGWKLPKEVAERLLVSLAHSRAPFCFEILGQEKAICAQMACDPRDAPLLAAQLRAHCPEVGCAQTDDAPPEGFGAGCGFAVDFGLSEEFVRPVRAAAALDPDPLIAAVGALEGLHAGESGILQVLFRAVRNPWAESIMRAVTDWNGKAFFADAPEMVALTKRKVASPLYAAVVRIAARSGSASRAMEISRGIGAVFSQFNDPQSNRFIPLENEGYPDGAHWGAVARCTSCRTGMILNLDELVSFVHPPSASVRSPKFLRDAKKTKAAPEGAAGEGVLLGVNRHQGTEREVRLPSGLRLRHAYVVGASGTGKSTLLLSMTTQDIARGEGVGLIDPHGDLADEVLARIPDARLKDVIVFDPSDEERPVAWNILQAHTPVEKTLLASDMVATFRRLSTSWGDQMTSVLGNAVLAILESDRGGSVSDLRRFLVDAAWRKEYLTSVKDPEIVFYWEKEFPLLSGRPQAPILTRLDAFLRPRPVRAMVTARRDRLDFRVVLDEQKIFLAKLAQGAIGEENSSLLGSLLVSKFHQVALSRQDAAPERRTHFYLYCDEFHHFVTPSMASLLSGARKYRLGLTLAHQELRQLASRDPEVAAAAIANPAVRVSFRVGEQDAKKLEESFASFDARDLQNLGVGEAIARIERSDWDFNLTTAPMPPLESLTARSRVASILAHSRATYGRDSDTDSHAVAPVAGANVEATDTVSGKPKRASRASGARLDAHASHDSKSTTAPADTAALGGRGGPQHKYLQELIRRWAEDRGYQVEIEKQVLDGRGSVDVVLEKPGQPPIACEISVTTSAEHEIENAQKCFAAGFEDVFLVAPDRDTLRRVRERAAKALLPRLMKKIHFVLPEQVFSAVSALESQAVVAGRAVPDVPAEVLTAKEVEALLRIDVKTIYRYVQRGMIPYVRVQSNLRFIKSEVLTWFAAHGAGGGTTEK